MSTKLTDAELLEIIQNPEKNEPSTQAQNNLPLFISTFGLEEGTLKIPVKLVYRLYKRWAKLPLGEDMFYKEMTLLLPNKTEIDGVMCYLLNQSTLKITEELYKVIKVKGKKRNTSYLRKHFESFMESCIITSGSDWILASDLRTTYVAWCKLKYKSNLLSLKAFEGFCRLYLDHRSSPLEVAVNKKVINVPQKARKAKTCQKD